MGTSTQWQKKHYKSNEIPAPYQIEKYILRWWKHQDEKEEIPSPTGLTNLPGRRSRPSDAEKLRAIKKWESIKQYPNGVTLEEFLESEFGITNGVLNVSRSAFYSWRRKLYYNFEDKS